MGQVCSWVDDNYKYEELRTTARSATRGTILCKFIGSVWHQISETRGYESQFYIANVTDRGHHGEFKKEFEINKRFKQQNELYKK